MPFYWNLDSSGKAIGEFEDVYFENQRYDICDDDLCDKYDEDTFEAHDGQIVGVADHLAAFIEAYVAIENGCSSKALRNALIKIERHSEEQGI